MNAGGESQSIGEQVAALARRVSDTMRRAAPARPAPAAPQTLAEVLAGIDGAGIVIPRQVDRRQNIVDMTSASNEPAAAGAPAWQPLNVREFRSDVQQLGHQLEQKTPPVGPFGVVHAASVLQLAVAALVAATRYTRPYVPEPGGVDYAVSDPGELYGLISMVRDVITETEALVAALQKQVGNAYHAAARGEWTAPPGATASAEVHAVARDLMHVQSALLTSTSRIDAATDRLTRLTRPAVDE